MTEFVIEMPPYRPTNGMRHIMDACGRIGAIQRLPGRTNAGPRPPRWVAYWSHPGGILHVIGDRDSRTAAIDAVLESHDHTED